MNRFFRSALFPLVIIAALVWLALQTLGGHGQKSVKVSYSDVISQVTTGGPPPGRIAKLVINPNKNQLKVTYANGEKAYVHYPSDQSEAQLEKQMQQHQVQYDSKGTGSSPWWSILTSLLPFVLLFGFWIFLMKSVKRGVPGRGGPTT